MKHKIIAFVAPLIAVLFVVGTAAGQAQYTSGTNGIDVSYPNCRTSLPRADFGVVGVNGGIVYSHNSCLKQQAGAFKNLSLYINTGLNNDAKTSTYYQSALSGCSGDTTCAAYQYGYNAAKDAVSYAQAQSVSSPTWWLDVETTNTWTSDTVQNQQSLLGARAALSDAGATTIGVYSTTAQWGDVTGGWQNDWPSWGATTWTTAKQAATYCTGHEFTGGPSYLMQYKSHKSKVDQDYAC